MFSLRVIIIVILLGFTIVLSSKAPVKFNYYNFPQQKNDLKIYHGLKIICHGLNGSSESDWYSHMIDGFQKKNFSVIAVDWKDLADDGYIDAIVAASNVAEKLSKEILDVSKKYSIDLGKVHIIGHSLGAHIAGYVGKSIIESQGEKIGRITGLDPAGPGFHSLLSNAKLYKDDAHFVDVIHTDTDFLGISLSIGHADFYPNGGALQTSCDVVDVGCSHRLAPDYFIESLKSDSFVARKCVTYIWYTLGFCHNNERAYMGFGCNRETRGDFFLNTNSKPPYGKG
ncbi:endothelial lipase-like [Onthophagus taurus]|uniref:endothelial lipase-like n=1 Tax=Onthophagus taurus TaxID=166361 RepID=UPI000C20A42F|nr:endothelial lipase-like [Onthophagus taurus]